MSERAKTLVKAGASAGFLDAEAGMLEVLGAIRRAGADIILTYFAPEYAAWYKKHHG